MVLISTESFGTYYIHFIFTDVSFTFDQAYKAGKNLDVSVDSKSKEVILRYQDDRTTRWEMSPAL
jgi:hypothetical protein